MEGRERVGHCSRGVERDRCSDLTERGLGDTMTGAC